jgi:hypothetical protein
VCTRFVEALEPNIKFEMSIPDQDCEGRTFPQLAYVAKVQSVLREFCGGHAPLLSGPTPYEPEVGPSMNEFTVVISSYMPECLEEETTWRLLAEILAFGDEARQEVVLVAVGIHALRFRFNVRPHEEEITDVVPRAEVA